MNEQVGQTKEPRVQAERVKLYYDSAKHLSLMASGSLLAVVGLHDKVPNSAAITGIFLGAILGFTACVLLCFIAMFGYATQIYDKYEPTKGNQKTTGSVFVSALACFYGGMFSFGAFAFAGFLMAK